MTFHFFTAERYLAICFQILVLLYNFIRISFIFSYVDMSVYVKCVCGRGVVCSHECKCPQKPEESIGSLGTGIIVDCELLNGGGEN